MIWPKVEGIRCDADEPDLTGLEAFDNVHSQQDFDAASEAWCRKKSKETGVQTAFSKPMPVAFLDTRHHHKASISPKVPRYVLHSRMRLLHIHIVSNTLQYFAKYTGHMS